MSPSPSRARRLHLFIDPPTPLGAAAAYGYPPTQRARTEEAGSFAPSAFDRTEQQLGATLPALPDTCGC